MSSDSNRKLAEDRPPRMVKCQQCSEEFDWHEDTCPHCGWDKSEWAEQERYGLEKSD